MVTDHVPLIGVSACHKTVNDHSVHAVAEKYVLSVVRGTGGMPVLIPPIGADTQVDALLDRLDGLLMTGSPSNVEPSRYHGPPSDEGTEHDARRDATTLPLICRAVEVGAPLFAICRGLQELNVALGGTLHQKVHELDHTFDHRMRRDVPYDRKYRYAHPVKLTAGGQLSRLMGGREEVLVNSLHAQAIDRLADRLAIEGVAPDGIIEAVGVRGARSFAMGVQWHPEYPSVDEPVSKALYAAFGDACRARALGRSMATPSAA